MNCLLLVYVLVTYQDEYRLVMVHAYGDIISAVPLGD